MGWGRPEGESRPHLTGRPPPLLRQAIVAKNPERDIVNPSLKGTEHMLGSVDKSGTVKRIIHTSSVAAVQSYDKPAGYIFTEKDEATYAAAPAGCRARA